MLKKEHREIEFDNYMDSETPKFEAKREDEQWNPKLWKIVVMLILVFLGLYFLLDRFWYFRTNVQPGTLFLVTIPERFSASGFFTVCFGSKLF